MFLKLIYFLMWFKLKPSAAPKIDVAAVANTAFMKETSGLVFNESGTIFSIEDSGNAPQILVLDTLGKQLGLPILLNAKNVDWEEMATDETHIFVGDFGNNSSRRQDLLIYTIDKQAVMNNDKINIGNIYFRYEDQTNFKPSIRKRRFDAEAMLSIGDSLYLFTKDYTVPLIGESRVYRLPKTVGNHIAQKVGTIRTDNAAYGLGQITAAALSPDQKTAVLLANNALYIFRDFELPRFWEGSRTQYNFEEKRQREGITFSDNCQVYISNEATTKSVAQLTKLDLCSTMIGRSPRVYCTGIGQDFLLTFEHLYRNSRLQIIDNQGNTIYRKRLKSSMKDLRLSESLFKKNEIYTLNVTHKSHKWSKKIAIKRT